MTTTSLRQIFQSHVYAQETHEIIKDKLSTCTCTMCIMAHVHVQFNNVHAGVCTSVLILTPSLSCTVYLSFTCASSSVNLLLALLNWAHSDLELQIQLYSAQCHIQCT